MRAKAQGERVADQRQESPEEYAQGEVQQGISGAVDRVNGTTQSTARMSLPQVSYDAGSAQKGGYTGQRRNYAKAA